MDSMPDRSSLPPAIAGAPLVAHARFRIGDVVRHRLHGFRGLIFDVDPVFANSEEWYESIPEDMRPAREQPFYHLFAENEEGSYIAYVSQQNLVDDDVAEPVNHPAISHFFKRQADGSYRMRGERWH
ncbi:MAG TPA: heat shock protein HspQ [Sphingobium sp.]